MNDYQFHEPTKPWLVLYCEDNFCHIIDRFFAQADAASCYRGLEIFVHNSADFLKVINVQDETTWDLKEVVTANSNA